MFIDCINRLLYHDNYSARLRRTPYELMFILVSPLLSLAFPLAS
jgi:hypothetical protein